jgi:hypothetical protein
MEILLVWLVWVATYRLTRLVTRDKIPLIDLPREAFVQRWGAYEGVKRQVHEGPRRNWIVRTWRWLFAPEFPAIRGGNTYTNLVMKSLAYLWECDWCTSMWVGAALSYTVSEFVALPYPWLVAVGASAATGLLATWEAELDKKASKP